MKINEDHDDNGVMLPALSKKAGAFILIVIILYFLIT